MSPSTSSGVYVLPAPTTATLRLTWDPPLPLRGILRYSPGDLKSLGKLPETFLGEIEEQPVALRRAGEGLGEQGGVLETIGYRANVSSIVFTGMGASYCACYAPVTVLAGRGRNA